MEIKNKNIYQCCLDELRTQVGYYEHLELGNKFIAGDFDEIVKILADVKVLDDKELVTINQTKLPVLLLY